MSCLTPAIHSRYRRLCFSLFPPEMQTMLSYPQQKRSIQRGLRTCMRSRCSFCEYISPFLFILSNGGAFPLFDQFQTGEKNIEKWGRERFLVVINGVARRFMYGRFCSVRAKFGNHAWDLRLECACLHACSHIPRNRSLGRMLVRFGNRKIWIRTPRLLVCPMSVDEGVSLHLNHDMNWAK